MASGILGSIEPAATTYTTLYKPSTGLVAGVTIQAQNRSASTRTIRIALTQDAASNPAPADGDFIIYDRTLAAAGDTSFGDSLQITGHTLGASGNDQVVVYASGIDVDFVCTGIEESA